MNDTIAETELPHWRPGDVRDAVTDFLAAAESLPEVDRVAVFDNDGTLWCERPEYVQQGFIGWALSERVARDPGYQVPETAQRLLEGGMSAVAGVSLEELAAAVNDVFDGLTPEQFAATVHEFLGAYRNPVLDRSAMELRYAPMLELIAALRRRRFAIYIVTGGGASFVQALSADAYGIGADRVIGTLVGYEFDETAKHLTRSTSMPGGPNEGVAKPTRIQQITGRRPVFAAGNSSGDAAMLDFAQAHDGPSLALLIDHDDDDREMAYGSVAASFSDTEPLLEVARRSGWSVVSMRDDWAEVFADGSTMP